MVEATKKVYLIYYQKRATTFMKHFLMYHEDRDLCWTTNKQLNDIKRAKGC